LGCFFYKPPYKTNQRHRLPLEIRINDGRPLLLPEKCVHQVTAKVSLDGNKPVEPAKRLSKTNKQTN
jgi:hypothetical protein